MTDERTLTIEKAVAELIGDSEEKAKEIFSLTPEELAHKLDGITAEEIEELFDIIEDIA